MAVKLVAHLRDAGSAGRPGYPALVLVKPVLSFAEGALVSGDVRAVGPRACRCAA